jgi:hypothetical protein
MEDHPGPEMRRFFARIGPCGYYAEIHLGSIAGVFLNPEQEGTWNG